MEEEKVAVVVFGTMEYEAVRAGDPLTASTLQILDMASDNAGLTIDLVFVSLDPKDAGKGKTKLGMKRIREERPRVLDEISQARADLVICMGPVATACVFGKGNLVEAEMLRQEHMIEGLPPVYVTYGIEQLRWKAGIAQWIELDFLAASRGQTKTEWGDYKVVYPGTKEWENGVGGYCILDLAGKTIGFDLETFPGLNPWEPGARIRMAVLSRRVGEAVVVLTDECGALPGWVHNLAACVSVKKVGSNIKFDFVWMRRFGYQLNNIEDTSTREHIIDGENPKKDLKSLTFKYLPRLGDYSKDQRALVQERGGWEHVKDEEMLLYAGADGEASLAAYEAQDKLLTPGKRRARHLYSHLYTVLARIEHRGMCIDMKRLNWLDELYKMKLSQLRQEIVAVLGPINLNSPTQLARALKEAVPNIKLTLREWTRVMGGEEDEESVTKREVLEREAHKHPIILKVLEFRQYRTRHSTFIEGVRDKHAVIKPWGRLGPPSYGTRYFIHPRYRTDVVETGRLSSQAPNGQNIPRKDNDDPDLTVKQQFVSRFENGEIMEADESQVEIRVAAELSKDKKMLEAIRSGEDIHRAMAAIMLSKPVEEVSDEERQLCKARTFLILYGGGAAKLARDLKITRRAAQRLIDDYFETFSGLRDYIQKIKDRVKVDLKVTTPFGFERRFTRPERWDSPDGFRIERQAFNTMVQMSAAALCYIAMIDAEKEMRRLGLMSIIIGQVHDSILVDVYPGEQRVVAEILRYCMEQAGVNAPNFGCDRVFSVPLKADVECGPSWGAQEPVNFEGENQWLSARVSG